jgi:hypothetical protein
MKKATFALQPFSTNEDAARYNLGGMLRRYAGSLSVIFHLAGPIHLLRIPSMHPAPKRTQGLWKNTCFECFIGTPASAGYWEFNLAPSRHWNIYRFDGYRQGMCREEAFDTLPIDLSLTQNTLQLALDIDLDRMNLSGRPIRLAISAVLVAKGGVKTYWALTHSANKPDFHHPDTFLLAL